MSSILPNGLDIYFILGLLLLSYFLIIIFAIQNRKLRKKYLKLVEGTNVANIESLILGIQQQVKEQEKHSLQQGHEIEELQEKLKHMKSNVYIHRYSAFSDETTGLSYSVVFLDDFLNGVVITGLYNREQSYTYAKPIEKGQSKYKLSPEELQAIQKTIESSFS